jgi:hypothetical protein
MRKEYPQRIIDKPGSEAYRTRAKLDILGLTITEKQVEEVKPLRERVRARIEEKLKDSSLSGKEKREEERILYKRAFDVAEDKKEEFQEQLQPTREDLANPEKYLGMKKIPEKQLK